MLSRAREHARRLQERSRPFVPLANHPLSPVAYKNWSPTWEEQTTVSIRDVINLVRLAIDAAVDLRNWLGYPRPEGSRQELAGLAVVARCLQAAQPIGPGFATTPWPQLLNWLDQWFGWAEERSQLRGVLQALHQPTAVTSTSVTSELWSSEVANKIISDAHELKVLTKAATQADKSLRAWLNIPRPTDSREETVSLIGLVDCLLAPMPVGSAFATTPWQEWVSEFDHWILLVKERSELLLRLNEYHVERLLSLDLDTIHRNYRSAQTSGGISRWIRVQFIRRRLRQTRIAQNLPKTETVGPILEAGDRLRAVVGELDGARSKAESLLGTVWANGEPQIDVLHRTRQWGETLNRYIDAVAVADIPWGNQLRQLLARLFGDGPSSYASGSMVGSRLSLYRDAITRFDECYESFFGDADLQRDTPETAPDFLGSVAWIIDTFIATVPRIRAIDAGFTDSAAIANGCLGKLWEGGEPAAEKIASARDWGRQLHSGMVDASHRHAPFLLQLRQKLAALFEAGPGTFGNGTDIRLFLTTFCNTQTAFNENFDYAATAISLRRQSLDTESDYLQTILATLLGLQNAWSKIREWCAWQQARSEGIAMGLTPLIEVLEGPEGDRCDLPTLFEHSFRRSLLFATIENESVLREFFGNEHNDRIAKFRSIDQKVAALARDSILARLAVGIPRDQKDDTIPKTEVGLLRREISKKRAHIPVRQLLAGMPNLLPRLKPCVLMSPLSVAQYLEPSHELFDVVIFDEASQIPVSDAIGAIARGKQLIVVGDPKQLPPTNFFNPNSGDEDEATPEEHKDLESILDELMSLGLRHKRLEWHYRSRHEALIAFSNRQYYANQLLTFPSPTGLLGGVQFVHLPQARYDKGKSRTNPAEAKALVKELVARLRAPATSRSSYGVVTFSVAQQQLIETLLDEERRHFPEIEHHFGEESPTDGEPVFVKNLENVQGDERDIILFSICYGPDETARLSLNFGPLNRDGGERRLNVAITRAKREMVVFSGLTAGQIDLTRTRARGVRDLKYFLDYAERGVKALTAAANASGDSIHESEFERLVAERIRATGYEVHHQVGCSGYRIDLGIVDPGAPGKYLLGVECDGATYHRAATARDRDKLRQLVLEGLGWKLHRIWSTDWWHNPEGEMEKLKAELARLTQRP